MNETSIDQALERLDSEWRRCQSQKDHHRAYIAAPNQPALLLDREIQLQVVLDAACRGWASDNKWPLLDEEAAYLLYARIQKALVFGRWIRDHADFSQKTACEVLVFLLVDYWLLFGRAIWGMQMKDRIR